MSEEPEKNGVEVYTSPGGVMTLFYGEEGQRELQARLKAMGGNRPAPKVYGIFDRRPTLDEELAKLGPHPLHGRP